MATKLKRGLTKADLVKNKEKTQSFLNNLLIWLDDNLTDQQKEVFCQHFGIKIPDETPNIEEELI